MVNYKRKAGKKTKTSSNSTRKGKRSVVSGTSTSTVSDHDRIPVVTSLPPAVDGHLRCFLRVSVPKIHWIIQKYPTDVQVRLRWWGEDGDGVLLRPLDDKADEQTRADTWLTCVRFAVCSGPKQFSAYLNDMGALIFEVVHGPSLIVFGHVRLGDVSKLSASTPIQGSSIEMSQTGKRHENSVVHITHTRTAYSQLSSSLVPTIDMEIDPQRQAFDESDARPTPPPSSLNPTEPIPHPRQRTEDMDLFISPAVPSKVISKSNLDNYINKVELGVKFAPTSPDRLEYTAEHSLISSPRTDQKGSDDLGSTVRSEEPTTSSQPLHIAHGGENESSDLIDALLQRGEKLREAMVMSADEANDENEAGGTSFVVDRNTPSGKLLKAILTSDEIKYELVKSEGEEDSVIESVFLHNNKAVDLLLGEDEKLYLDDSPNSTPESSIVSEPGDPLHDDTLLKDLFYTTPIVQSDTDSDSTVVTDEVYDDDDKSLQNPLQEDQFEKALAKTRIKKRSPKTASRDISTLVGKEVNGKQNPEGNDDLTNKSRMGYLDLKQNSADDTNQDSRGQDSVHMSSESSTSTSLDRKPPRVDPDVFTETLGPEQLTALGRVDSARVMVDSLGIANETIKPGTFFVEYYFPTSTPTHGQDQDITMATELTRIVSKRIQDRVVLFGHHSVFPVLFNSVVIDYWWRLPLTFRLYFRESGERKPVVIGAATFPLKTVLLSDTLSSSASLQIKCDIHSKEKQSSDSSSLHDIRGSCGPLLVKVVLMADRKQVHLKTKRHRKPPLPTATILTATEHVHVARPAYTDIKNVGKVSDKAPHEMKEILKTTSKPSSQDGNHEDGIQYDRDPLTLYSLLWIPEGQQLTQQRHHANKYTPTSLAVKSNLYLVCRTFWCEELSKSRVCWGESNPSFGFKQVAPVLLTSSLLQRVCNNFMVIEVWNRIGQHDQGDKASLPLAKLCAMVTMQKQGEANIQTFSLPLAVLAGDEMDGIRQGRIKDTGLLDVIVKYKQVKVELTAEVKKEDDSHVCLSFEVFRACGLQAAAVLHAKSNPSLSYPAEVGVNAYLVIQVPLGKKHKHVTRTVARTFTPEFSYNADISLLLVTPSGVNGRGDLSLAEQLEDSEVVFEVWHQMSRERRSDQLGRSEAETNCGTQRDVLLGVARVPLVKLLAHNRGIKGWFPIHWPGEQDTLDASPHNEINKVVGGLELGITFSKTEDRDHVIHISRGLGWSPPPEVDCDEVWLDREKLSLNKHWTFCIKISSAWIPSSELKPFCASAKTTEKLKTKGYARYKLYNKVPICSRMSSVKDCGDDKFICELKHSKEIVLPASHSLSWHMREESLEIQLWLSSGGQTADTKSKKRDRLVGSAYLDVSSLLASKQRKHTIRQISGLYPLFRSGASNLFGGCIHVQSFVKVEDTSEHESLSSDESIDASSILKDQTADSRLKIPYQDQVSSVEPMQQHQSNGQLPVTEAIDDTFMAHVIIEQALHLPTVPGTSENRVMPNVYVSYQTLPSISPACTPVVMCSSSPRWEYQKMERIINSPTKLQDFQFKVWHSSEAKKGKDNTGSQSFEPRVDSSSEDRLIGSVSFDLSPLLAGMRQLIGWYNVTDFNGDCQGQIKLGICPVNPLSPTRSFTSSRVTHSQVPKQDAPYITPLLKSQRENGSNYQNQRGNPLASQLQGCFEHSTGFKLHSAKELRMTTEEETEAVSSCSSSLLFSQLRHNMKELDILQQNLTIKLRSNPVSSDDGCNQEDSHASHHPPYFFSGRDETTSFPLESSRTLRTDNKGDILEEKSTETEFKESGNQHVELNGKQMTLVRNDDYKVTPPKLSPELKQTGSFVDYEKTALRSADYVQDSGATILTHCELQEPFAKCREDYLKHASVLVSLPEEKNQLSVVQDCQLPVKSEPSLTDISGDLSVGGYVQDNTNDTRFADLKDSWLSSEEEENSDLSQAEKPGMLNSPSALNSNTHTAGELKSITVTNFHNTESGVSEQDHDFSGTFGNKGEHHKDVHVISSEAERKQSCNDDSIGSHDSAEDFTRITSLGSGGITAAGRRMISEHSNINETHSNKHGSNNSLTPNEMVKQDSLPRYPPSYQQTSAMLPNFFMPSEQLAESMRALRLGSSNTSSHSKLLAHSQHTGNNQCTKENLTEKFARRKHYKAKRDERPPISTSESQRGDLVHFEKHIDLVLELAVENLTVNFPVHDLACPSPVCWAGVFHSVIVRSCSLVKD
ncbi:C2 domain-containing protein 3 [Stylophora pistillata]|uniref:C2 domain-containing protein 3 n=1 Tax=Stylophora pistillata TaxID=50429 RepID=A0A2B4SHL7_STYPI|nr:C2 domain-containing protein 3 [Stylophora pistillata]